MCFLVKIILAFKDPKRYFPITTAKVCHQREDVEIFKNEWTQQYKLKYGLSDSIDIWSMEFGEKMVGLCNTDKLPYIECRVDQCLCTYSHGDNKEITSVYLGEDDFMFVSRII
jgi:hypothetical protein